MTWTLAGTLDRIEPRLPDALVSGPAYARVRAVAAHLSAAMTSRLHLECRLSGQSRTDLTIRVDARDRHLLAADRPAGTDPMWARITDFAHAWPEDVTALWLEFDVVGEVGPHRVPVPHIFAELARHAAPERIVPSVLERLCGPPLSRSARRTVERCLERLPAGARIPYIGFLPRPGPHPIRLCVSGLNAETLSDYLAALSWPGEVSPAADMSIVNLSVGHGIAMEIGVEYAFDRIAQLRGTLRERALLDALVAGGLCVANKRDAVFTWPGWSPEELPHQICPGVLGRWVNHVKIIYDQARPRRAKAYLCLDHGFPFRRVHVAVQ
jgi:hypothetical protein